MYHKSFVEKFGWVNSILDKHPTAILSQVNWETQLLEAIF